MDAVFNERMHPILAKDKVRHVGEVVACVIAESRYLAEDAVHQVIVDYDPLPVLVDLEKAVSDDAALIHEEQDDVWLFSGKACMRQ